MSPKQQFQLVIHVVVLAAVLLALVPPIWSALLFPHEEHPYLLIALGILVAAFPPVVWWRWRTNSKRSRNFETAITAIVIAAGYGIVGRSLCLFSWAALRPVVGTYSGEIVGYSFIFAAVGFVSGLLLVCLPLAVDSAFFSPAARHTFWLSLAALLAALGVTAFFAGPRMDWVFA